MRTETIEERRLRRNAKFRVNVTHDGAHGNLQDVHISLTNNGFEWTGIVLTLENAIKVRDELTRFLAASTSTQTSGTGADQSANDTK